jgi:hypothetical protein
MRPTNQLSITLFHYILIFLILKECGFCLRLEVLSETPDLIRLRKSLSPMKIPNRYQILYVENSSIRDGLMTYAKPYYDEYDIFFLKEYDEYDIDGLNYMIRYRSILMHLYVCSNLRKRPFLKINLDSCWRG